MPRTDIHRPGAIIPADYQIALSYNLATTFDGWPIPSLGVSCELDRRRDVRDADGKLLRIENGQHAADGRCCVLGLMYVARVKFAATGGTGQCSVCGVHFVYGDVWEHIPTGEHIHIGHQCADKYELVADRSAYELERGHREAAAARAIIAAQNKRERDEFLAAHPGLEADLAVEHHIIGDIAARFRQFRNLSDAQVELVRKIAAEVRNPAAAEPTIPAPITGKRQIFEGMVVSAKAQESMAFGTTYKMLVKMATPAGYWLAWSTIPAALLDSAPVGRKGRIHNLRGAKVSVTATLQPGNNPAEPHFCVAKRPTGHVVEFSAEAKALLAEEQEFRAACRRDDEARVGAAP